VGGAVSYTGNLDGIKEEKGESLVSAGILCFLAAMKELPCSAMPPCHNGLKPLKVRQNKYSFF
jgi:hypothetical protein